MAQVGRVEQITFAQLTARSFVLGLSELLNSPFKVKPGEFVELRTCIM